MFIEGISIGGYRSFGAEPQRIGPCQKVNLLAGPNNSGKSNVLSFLREQFVGLVREGLQYKLKDTDRHIGPKTARFTFGLGASPDGRTRRTIEEKWASVATHVAKIFSSDTLTNETGLAWFEYEASPKSNVVQLAPSIVEHLNCENVLSYQEWQRVWHTITGSGGGDLKKHCIPETIRAFSPIELEYPDVSFVPAIRRIAETKKDEEHIDSHDLSGAGLIDRLARLERPPYNRQVDKERFEAINRFLRTVTDNTAAILEIPYDRDMIIVHMDGKSLPLTSLGTGIHEVVILAAAATVVENQIVCMEEPELHLHPLLQRKLVRYLIDNTSNQYFISTHSAHLLETEGAGVFRVRMVDGETRVSVASTAQDKWTICRDLGYQASDILQCNCIIWVEGPSDRIYLNHWIRSLDPGLVEGIHYSIMFYGGRLLRHLSANDTDVEEFISLRRLNRNLVIVADSDKSSPHKRINKTKKRVRDEFDEGPGFAWITKGREIENYVAADLLRKAVEAVSPGKGGQVDADPYGRALPVVNPKAKNPLAVDKVKVAREVAKLPAQLNVLDLKQQMGKLAAFIEKCNK